MRFAPEGCLQRSPSTTCITKVTTLSFTAPKSLILAVVLDNCFYVVISYLVLADFALPMPGSSVSVFGLQIPYYGPDQHPTQARCLIEGTNVARAFFSQRACSSSVIFSPQRIPAFYIPNAKRPLKSALTVEMCKYGTKLLLLSICVIFYDVRISIESRTTKFAR